MAVKVNESYSLVNQKKLKIATFLSASRQMTSVFRDMSDNLSGVPITYVADPPVAAGNTIVSGGSIAISGQPLLVYVQGGTIGASFSFVGSVTTDIGNVKLEDADDNYAVIPPAQDLKTTATKALVVQTVDRVGQTLSLANQEAIVNNGSNANDLLANIDLNTTAPRSL